MPKLGEDAPKMAQDGLKMAQDELKIGSRNGQDSTRCPQDGPKYENTVFYEGLRGPKMGPRSKTPYFTRV